LGVAIYYDSLIIKLLKTSHIQIKPAIFPAESIIVEAGKLFAILIALILSGIPGSRRLSFLLA